MFRDSDDDKEDSSLSLSGGSQPAGQHHWIVKSFTKPTYCNVCRQTLAAFQRTSLCCQVCKVKIHKRCAQNANCSLDCKWTTLKSCGKNAVFDNGEMKMLHQWVEGNLPFGIRCCVCSRKCGSFLRLQDFRCLWCRIAIHSSCMDTDSLPQKFCTLAQCRLSVLPPTAIHSLASGYQAVKPVASSPLIVFINLKSGSQEGACFLRRFRQLLNPLQVNSLTLEGAAPGLLLCANLDSFRVLVCGGDGSVGWVLSEIDKLGLISKCYVSMMPLGTGNDLSRVLGWGSSVSVKQDVGDIIKRMEQAQIKMLDRWSILSYVFPSVSERLPDSSPSTSFSRTRRSPFAFILRLENQISSQLEDLGRLCTSLSTHLATTENGVPISADSSTRLADNSSNNAIEEMQKRIKILPDLVHSFVANVMSVGASHRCSKSVFAEITTACDAVEGRIQDLVRCWMLIQSRSMATAESKTQSTQSRHRLNNMQNFLRPPPLSTTPEFDSGCSSDFDVSEELPLKFNVNRVTMSTSALVRTMSTIETPSNPVAVLVSVIRNLRMLIPQLTSLLASDSTVGAANPETLFRSRISSTGRTLVSSDSISREKETWGARKKSEPDGHLAVPIQFSTKAVSCGAIAALNDSNSGDSGYGVNPDEPFAASPTNETVKPEPTSRLFEKATPKVRPSDSLRPSMASVSSSNNADASSPTPAEKKSLSVKELRKSYMSRTRSPGPVRHDNGFIRQMLYSSARTLSTLCRRLMIPDSSLSSVTPASAPFEERCVMNNYFGIGLDAKIALDFHIRREEAPQSYKSRAKNMGRFGMLATKQFVQQSYKNLEQRVQLECDGKRLPLPSLQGIVILNIPSYMGGVNFWGSSRASRGYKAPSFDDNLLEVVAVFGSAQMAASRVYRIHHHRIAQCRTVRITILDAPLPVQVDGEAWLHPPGVIMIRHKNRAWVLARNADFVEVLRAWHRSSSTVNWRPEDMLSERRSRGRKQEGETSKERKSKTCLRSVKSRGASPNGRMDLVNRMSEGSKTSDHQSVLSQSSSDLNCVYFCSD